MKILPIFVVAISVCSGSGFAQEACGQGDCETGVDGFAGHQEASGGINGTPITETSGVNNPANDGQISGRVEFGWFDISISGQLGGAGVTKQGTDVLQAGN